LQAQVLAEAEDGGLAEEGLVVELQGIGEAELSMLCQWGRSTLC
jgi:hypothetical protein